MPASSFFPAVCVSPVIIDAIGRGDGKSRLTKQKVYLGFWGRGNTHTKSASMHDAVCKPSRDAKREA